MIGNVTFKYAGKLTTLEQMRAELPDSILLPALERVVAATHTSKLSHTPCPIHGKLPQVIVEVTSDGKIDVQTVSCCDLMEKKVTGFLRSTLNATAYFQPGVSLFLQVVNDYTEPYIFDINTIDKLILGRHSDDDDSPLDIDFNLHGGQQKGVSRRHAWIIWKSGALHLVDNGSANGTFLNGTHLKPFQPYKLHDTDTIRLGKLHVEVRLMEI
jgi:FHA domain